MTILKELKDALEGFDENLDVRLRMYPIHVGESVDGHEAGDFEVKQKTYVEVTYYYPLVRPREKDKDKHGQSKHRI